MQQFDERKLREQLDGLSADGRAAFAAACAERLLRGPAGVASDSLAEAHTMLDQLWGHLLLNHLPTEKLAELAQRAEGLVPDAETTDSWTAEDALAENALAALAYALHTAATGDSQSAVWCARQAIEALDLDTSERLGVKSFEPQAERAIVADPRIQAELCRQQTDMRDVASLRGGDPRVGSVLRARAQQDAMSFLG
jgi:hypothetical protein